MQANSRFRGAGGSQVFRWASMPDHLLSRPEPDARRENDIHHAPVAWPNLRHPAWKDAKKGLMNSPRQERVKVTYYALLANPCHHHLVSDARITLIEFGIDGKRIVRLDLKESPAYAFRQLGPARCRRAGWASGQ